MIKVSGQFAQRVSDATGTGLYVFDIMGKKLHQAECRAWRVHMPKDVLYGTVFADCQKWLNEKYGRDHWTLCHDCYEALSAKLSHAGRRIHNRRQGGPKVSDVDVPRYMDAMKEPKP